MWSARKPQNLRVVSWCTRDTLLNSDILHLDNFFKIFFLLCGIWYKKRCLHTVAERFPGTLPPSSYKCNPRSTKANAISALARWAQWCPSSSAAALHLLRTRAQQHKSWRTRIHSKRAQEREKVPPQHVWGVYFFHKKHDRVSGPTCTTCTIVVELATSRWCDWTATSCAPSVLSKDGVSNDAYVKGRHGCCQLFTQAGIDLKI